MDKKYYKKYIKYKSKYFELRGGSSLAGCISGDYYQ
jgi:hypothetical protein